MTPSRILAQSAPAATPWALSVSAAISSGSDRSAPVGLRMYSGVGIEVGVMRRVATHFEAAATLRTESREMDSIPASGARQRWGSVEFLPFTLQIRYRPARNGRTRPYLGVGVGVVVAWEESGRLDTLDFTPTVGPVIEAGVERSVSPDLAVAIRARSEGADPWLERHGGKLAQFDIDPFTLLAGVTIRL